MVRFVPLSFLLSCISSYGVVLSSHKVEIVYPKDGMHVPKRFKVWIMSYSNSPGLYIDNATLFIQRSESRLFHEDEPTYELYVDGKLLGSFKDTLMTLELEEGWHILEARLGYRSDRIRVFVKHPYYYELEKEEDTKLPLRTLFLDGKHYLIYAKDTLQASGFRNFGFVLAVLDSNYMKLYLMEDSTLKFLMDVGSYYVDGYVSCRRSVMLYFNNERLLLSITKEGNVHRKYVHPKEIAGFGCKDGYADVALFKDGKLHIDQMNYPDVRKDGIVSFLKEGDNLLLVAYDELLVWNGKWIRTYVEPVSFRYSCYPPMLGISFIMFIPIPILKFSTSCTSYEPYYELKDNLLITPKGKFRVIFLSHR